MVAACGCGAGHKTAFIYPSLIKRELTDALYVSCVIVDVVVDFNSFSSCTIGVDML